MHTLELLWATEVRLKAHTRNEKRIKFLGMKQKCEYKKLDKHKQMRSSRLNDILEQWEMHRAVRDEVLGSIIGSSNQINFFPCLIVSIIQLKHSYLFHY